VKDGFNALALEVAMCNPTALSKYECREAPRLSIRITEEQATGLARMPHGEKTRVFSKLIDCVNKLIDVYGISICGIIAYDDNFDILRVLQEAKNAESRRSTGQAKEHDDGGAPPASQPQQEIIPRATQNH
jgi:hypothetical protein